MSCSVFGEEGIGSPETGVMDSCQLLCGCWELNPESQQEQSVLLTAEPSLQPPKDYSPPIGHCGTIVKNIKTYF